MRIVKASYQIMRPNINDPSVVKDIYSHLEAVGRVCYKGEYHIMDEGGENFIKRLIANQHTSILEHAGITGKPHPQMSEVMEPLLTECGEKMPALFSDIRVESWRRTVNDRLKQPD